MHSPTLGKVNQLRSAKILWNLNGIASNHLSVEGNHFTLYFLIVFCGKQLEVQPLSQVGAREPKVERWVG